MTTRVPARHRAPVRPRTPLTDLGDAIGRRAGDAGRAGAVVAAAGGLLVTVAVPAGAAPAAAPAAVGTVSTAVSAELTTAVDSAFGTTAVGVVSAPATAGVVTTLAAFSTVPTPAPPPPPVVVERSTRSAVDAPVVEASVDQAVLDAARAVPAVQAVAPAPAPVVEAPPAPAPAPSLGQQILAVADDYAGVPYVYGGTTPAGFDCSGYTSYVLRQVGISVPRTANAQLGASARISRGEAVAGDLVFFTDGGRAYHVGIYAGDGMMWDAPRSGKPVQLRSVWSDSAVFGRVAPVA
ncbi:C40 family peptidase [Kineococcus auxinigenes]|uniref:C40 family peptidase n=1 Tax=unclassified Kineococcus TaxID=2621656 RepID=UPI003D7D607A